MTRSVAMDYRLLIDALVRDTMVLIAQLSTAAGSRSALCHVADKVFLDLVHNLEAQGVGKKVIADMFGLALRSYQQKVQRLTESATDRGTTLWEAVRGYLLQCGTVTKASVLRRFARDDERTVRSILEDLVDGGFLFRSGRGDSTVYRTTRPEDLPTETDSEREASRAAVVWLELHHVGSSTASGLAERLGLSEEGLAGYLDSLISEGRVTCSLRDGVAWYECSRYFIALGEPAGWEAAVLDHHRALVGAVCAKLRMGRRRATEADTVGGSTYSFDLWQGHPLAPSVESLLADTRQRLSKLWDEVSAFNAEARSAGRAPAPEGRPVAQLAAASQSGTPGPDQDQDGSASLVDSVETYRVSFYFGQNVMPFDGEPK